MVSFGESDEILSKKLLKKGVKKKELKLAKIERNGQGRYCLFDSGASLLRLVKIPETPDEYGYLAHEIFHVVSAIMYKIGMPLQVTVSCEAYAYLTGFLTTEIMIKISS